MQKVIYTDRCDPVVEDRIQAELGLLVVRRMPDDKWNIQDSSRIITDPRIVLAVINEIDEVSLMEIGLLLFLCKPILVTDKAVQEYNILSREVNFTEPSCSLKEVHTSFISWYNYMERSKNG